MITGMCRCSECGIWFFNWKKLHKHLVVKHDFRVELPETEQEESSVNGAQVQEGES